MFIAVRLESFPQFDIIKLRDITAAFLSEICHNVSIEPLYTRCLGNSSIIDLLMLKMVPTLMSVQRVPGIRIGPMYLVYLVCL